MVVFLVGVNDCDGGDRLKYLLKMQDFHRVFEVEVYVLEVFLMVFLGAVFFSAAPNPFPSKQVSKYTY